MVEKEASFLVQLCNRIHISFIYLEIENVEIFNDSFGMN